MNKIKSHRFLWALLSLALLLPLFSSAARPFPQEGSDLPVDARVQWGTLDNGIRYVIFPWDEPPGRLSLRLLVEAGSVQESDRQQGLAHLLEHMAFNGSRNFSAGEMVEYFQRLGMAFGPDTNAHTWWRETVYKLELPTVEASILDDGLLLLRDYADGLLLAEEEIEKEKGVVLSEMRDGDTPQLKEYRDGIKFSLPDGIIAERLPIGMEDVVRMASRDDLLDYYTKWYVPERFVLIGVGDIDPEVLLEAFNKHFGDMKPSEEPPAEVDWGEVLPAGEKTRIFSHPELPNASVSLYVRRPIEARTDTLEARREVQALNLATAMLNLRLDRLAKEEGAPFLSGTAYDYRWVDFVRYSGIELTTLPENWEPALDLAVAEVERAIRFGFSESELAQVRATRINALEKSAETASTRKSRELSSSLVRSIRDGYVFMDPVEQLAVLRPMVEAITLEEINSAYAAAWDIDERLVYVSGNFSGMVTDAFADARAQEIEPPAIQETAAFAYTDFGTPAKVVSRTPIEDLGIEQVVLSNGVRVNIKYTDYEANRIHVKAAVGFGSLTADPEKPGLGLLTDSTFIQGGLGAHSFEELRTLTAGRTVATTFSVEDDHFALGGVTNEEDFELQLQLIAAYLTDPGFRPEAHRLFLRNLDGLYNQLTHVPGAVLVDKGARLLASGDFRFGFPTRSELEARTLEESAAWLKSQLMTSPLEVAVVGDFADSERILQMVNKVFGALPEREWERPEFTDEREVAFPADLKEETLTVISESDRAIVTVNWPTADQSDIKRTRRLSILSSIVSDRMRVQIRENIGAAYSPYATNSSSDTYSGYGFLRAYVGVDPGQIDSIQSILLEIGDTLVAEGISEDELVRAIEPVKNQIEEYRRTNGYWLNSVALRSQSQPERLEWARSFADFWGTITVEEIEELAKSYLSSDRAAAIRVVPGS
jgi:zinc protease